MTRLPAVRRADVAPGHVALFDEIAGASGELSPFYGLLMTSPELAARVRSLGAHLRASCSPALFEIVALAVGGASACEYEMKFHRQPLRDHGFTDTAIAAIASGNVPGSISREHALAATFAQQLARHRNLSPALIDEAVAVFGPRGCLEMAALCGYIAMVSQLANVFDLS